MLITSSFTETARRILRQAVEKFFEAFVRGS